MKLGQRLEQVQGGKRHEKFSSAKSEKAIQRIQFGSNSREG